MPEAPRPSRMHDWLQEVWYGKGSGGFWLIPLSWLFGGAVALRLWLYRRALLRSYTPRRPVAVVGNLTVGGAGKTPLTLWLARRLSERGVRTGIITRGYRRSGAAMPAFLATRAHTFAELGDEALLLFRRSGVPVAVGADRLSAAELLAAEGVDLILSDDGLQHLRLRREFEIVVIDGERRFGNRRLLPAGPLREPLSRRGSVDAVVVNGAAREPGEIGMTLAPGDAQRVDGGGARPLAAFSGSTVHAVAAIGNPGRFFSMLESLGIEVIRHAWPDHYALSARDLDFGDALPVLMTEKDAMRCESFAAPTHWYVPVEARLPEGDAEVLLAKLGEVALPALPANRRTLFRKPGLGSD